MMQKQQQIYDDSQNDSALNEGNKQTNHHHHHHHHHHHQQQKHEPPLLPSQQQLPLTPSTSWTRDKKVLYSVNDTIVPSTVKRSVAGNNTQSRISTDMFHKVCNNESSSGHHRHKRITNEDISNNIAPTNNNAATNQPNAIHHTPPPQANTTIIGHYELKKTLGKGNFSTVKLAQHRITHHSVAIKVVKTSALSEDNLMKINREIDVLKKLGKHNHVVRLYQVIKTKRYFMLVTEYCANGELYDYLVDKGKLSEPKSCNYFLQILSAVEYLHDHNVVHRDLKAENLLLTDDFNTIKIADFGFANYYKHDKLLSTWCGSPPYAAPELFKGLQYVGPPVDIWSMGVILYVLVCGSLPFDGHNLVFLKSRVLSGKFRIPFFMSTECEGLIRGMLRLDPERRFSIRHIRAHCWIKKHTSVKEPSIETNSPTIFMEATGNQLCSTTAVAEISSTKNLEKSNNMGQSLDLDDKKKPSSSTNPTPPTEDASMLCLTSSCEDKPNSRSDQKDTAKRPSSKIQSFVDTEIANAVSNMSLDSNTSSMSVSQSNDTTATNHSGATSMSASSSRASCTRPDSGNLLCRHISKENSIDDQIIEFMVDNLKVADSQSSIRQSIANNKYDDLHAIYRLIRDQPKIMFETRAARFKIPSLPLISLKKQQSVKKPSITTGFFNAPSTTSGALVNNTILTCDTKISHNSDIARDTQERFDYDSCKSYVNDTLQISAIDLVRHTGEDKESTGTSSWSGEQQQLQKSEDQTWSVPPQLFLTPPSENRAQTFNQISIHGREKRRDSELPDVNLANSATVQENNEFKQVMARHSFDSTIQQLNESSGVPGSSTNKLALTSSAKHCLWDSSILDTLGVSTPPVVNNQSSEFNMAGEGAQTSQATNKVSLDPNEALQMVQNLAGITTNLPQIGAETNVQTPINQNLLLAQLNSLALSAAVTQSSMLAQSNMADQRFQAGGIKFTPNNLMNQNFNVLNPLTIQNNMNNPCIPNLSLLDPNILGLERRASDGQASYNSLTTSNDGNQTSGQGTSVDSSSASNNITSTSLSSSSNQLDSCNLNRCQINKIFFTRNVENLVADHQTQTNPTIIRVPSINDQHHPSDTNQLSVESNPQNQHDQINPLDLTKGTSKEYRQLDGGGGGVSLVSDKNSQLFDDQLSKTSSQRSHSTTSASVLLNNFSTSATTSPRSSLFMSNTRNNNSQSNAPFCQVSPSSISLTGGGPGHLLNRRKRHSLETESRHHHYQPLGIHHQQHPVSSHHPTGFHPFNSYNESNRSTARQNSNHQYPLQYPLNSHIGQLRNFAQTFSYKKLLKKQQLPATNWDSTNDPPSAAMDVGSQNSSGC